MPAEKLIALRKLEGGLVCLNELCTGCLSQWKTKRNCRVTENEMIMESFLQQLNSMDQILHKG